MPDKMAVTSENQHGTVSRKDSFNREEGDQRLAPGAQRPGLDSLPKKKSTFKITSITKNTPRGASSDLTYDADGDSLDDLDESHTEEVSSEILDSSRNTDVELDPTSSEDTTHNLTPDDTVLGPKDKTSDIQSRFKVVKIETHEPFRRGRWLCHDFLDPSQAATEKTEIRQNHQDESHSGNSSAGSSIHYVHGADDPSKNPLTGGLPHSQGNATAVSTSSGQMGHLPNDQVLPGGVSNTAHASTKQNTNDFQPINPAQSNQQPNVAQKQGNVRGDTPAPQLPVPGQVGASQPIPHQSQAPHPHQSITSQQVPSQVSQGATGGAPQGMANMTGGGMQQHQPQQPQIAHNLPQTSIPNPVMSHSQTSPAGSIPQTPSAAPQAPHSQTPHNPMQPSVLHTPQGIPREVNTGGLPASHLPPTLPDHLKNSQAGGAAVHMHQVGHPSTPMPHLHQSSHSHESANLNNIANINMRKISAPSNLQSVPASDASAMPVEKLPHHGGTSSVTGAEGLPKGNSVGHTNHIDAGKREFLRLDNLASDENVGSEGPSGDMNERVDMSTPLLTPLAAAVGGLSSPTKEGKEEVLRYVSSFFLLLYVYAN